LCSETGAICEAHKGSPRSRMANGLERR
jgi:hypothetical protein